MKVVEVVAAVIKKDNKILGTARGYGHFKGMWEFPGGKPEEGETKEEALVREIKEELNADIKVDDYICTVEYDYKDPDFHLTMHTYFCTLLNDHMELVYHDEEKLEHEAMKWLSKEELDTVEWLGADIEIVNKLKELL
ncbi:MAG: (deoxy)nucleoside triphosphate pyrophosphohydrolase [Bacilli bacterium]|nr:(deoxy)nucleoside triphosphate pyrophosphohydrolase [Bacilli bacterium]